MEKLKFKTLKKTIWIYILVISTVLTTIFTMISASVDYYKNVDKQNLKIDEIKKTYTASITSALWDVNVNQIEKQLNGIVKNKDILSAAVYEKDDESKWIFKNIDQNELFNYQVSIPLIHNENEIGSFKLIVTKFYIIKEAVSFLIRFFIFQGLKTFIASFIVFIILEKLIIQHVVFMSKYLKEYESSTYPNFSFIIVSFGFFQ